MGIIKNMATPIHYLSPVNGEGREITFFSSKIA